MRLDARPLLVVERDGLLGGVVKCPGGLITVDEGEERVAVDPREFELSFHVRPLNSKVSALRQHVEHLCGMASGPPNAIWVCQHASGVVLWSLVKQLEVCPPPAEGDVPCQGPGLAREDLV